MSNLLINIPNSERTEGRTPDSIKYNKHCDDFICLSDGTIMRECKYCNLSLNCRQVDLSGGNPIPMEANYLPIADPKTGEIIEHQLFCTGMWDLRPLKERLEDDKIS
jgi:hypothetical protein